MKQISNVEEYRQRLRELKNTIYRKAEPFPGDTPELKAERIKRAKNDYYYFAETYFKHYIDCVFAEFQKEEIEKALRCIREKRGSVQAEFWFRGSGKTVNFGIIIPLWLALRKEVMFSIFVGKDQKIITERTLAIRAELMYNRALLADYPDMAMQDSKGEVMAQGEEADFEAPNGARFLALGYKMAIRGRLHGKWRPGYILIDDFENHMDTNPEIAKDKLTYVTGEAFGACGRYGGIIIWLGNLTHSQSAANRFVERCKQEPDNTDISYRLVPGIDKNEVPTWPEAFTKERMAAIRQVMGQAEFNRQILMKPAFAGGVFKEEWFKIYNPYAVGVLHDLEKNNRLTKAMKEKLPTMDNLPGIEEIRASQIVTYCDPSLGNKESNDYKAVETVAFCRGFYFVLDRFIKHATINEMFNYMYGLDLKYKTKFFMEDNFWQTLLWQFIPPIAEKKGYLLPVQGVTNLLSKVERILSLQPLYEYGFIYDCTAGKDFNVFKEQLLSFPNGNNDDGPDAEAGAICRFKELSCGIHYESVEQRAGGFDEMP